MFTIYSLTILSFKNAYQIEIIHAKEYHIHTASNA